MIVVYKLSNKINNRFYIGSSKNYKNRINDHFYKLKNNKHENPFLQRDFNKCGIENFDFQILEQLDSTNILLEREQYYLNEYFDKQDKCYNINPIAKNPPITIRCGKDNPMYGRIGILNPQYNKPKSEETKQKLRLANLGKKYSAAARLIRSARMIGVGNHMFGKKHNEKTRLKISLSLMGIKHPNFGKQLSEETKRKLSIINTGKKRSLETKIKMSTLAKTRVGDKNAFYNKKHSKISKEKISNARKKTARRILCINLLDGIKVEYNSILEASKNCNFSRSTIQLILNKKQLKTSTGLYFEYLDKDVNNIKGK